MEHFRNLHVFLAKKKKRPRQSTRYSPDFSIYAAKAKLTYELLWLEHFINVVVKITKTLAEFELFCYVKMDVYKGRV